MGLFMPELSILRLLKAVPFPGGSDGKASAYSAGDLGSISGSGRSPREGNGNPLQYSCLENPMDGGSWLGYSPWGHKESDMTEQLHFHFHNICEVHLLSRMYVSALHSFLLPKNIPVSEYIPFIHPFIILLLFLSHSLFPLFYF